MRHGDGPYDIERYKTRLKTKYKTEDDLLHHISEESNKPAYKKFIDDAAKKPPTTPPKEPTDAVGWLKKAYIDHDPADGAPKVGGIGYV